MYTVSNPPQSFADVYQELMKLQEALNGPMQIINWDTLYAAPTKPREGMVVKADGSTWNPGSGAGWYGYRAGAWRFLG